ncbi:hypothetical protein DID88_007885 [Monilinia fructigena]|uniref:ERCC4 domain-containing protein n=1 Tax=Monilinia fructigena TaxID=38457 RepID=A0A395J3L3_9HELO|nr:hypothetical protein DID88_007885 [Monilinia fructigena]
MQHFVDLTTPSPEPELPKACAKAASNPPLKDTIRLLLPTPKRRKASPPKDKAPRVADGYKRTVSNIESVGGSKLKQYKYSLNRSKSMDADPILFTSSPDVSAIRSRNGKGKAPSSRYYDDDESETAGVLRKKASMLDPVELEDSDEFPSIENVRSWNSAPKKAKAPEEPMVHYYDEESSPEKKKKKKREKAKDKALKRAKVEKEREKEKSKILAKVNNDRTKPEISASEMIVDLPSCIQDKSNTALRGEIDILLAELNVEQSRWENSDLVIKWRRKVISEYSEESGIWEPKPLQIKDEKHILCVLPAKKFVDMILKRGDEDLDAHVSVLKSQFESCKLIYLIVGLTAWQRKNLNVKDRQFKAAVGSRIPGGEVAGANSQRRKVAQADEYVEDADDLIEDALLSLEIVHKVRYWLTADARDSAKWVSQLTKHISTIPYLAQREGLGLNSCMASGQFRSGKDATDTYVKMLEKSIM